MPLLGDVARAREKKKKKTPIANARTRIPPISNSSTNVIIYDPRSRYSLSPKKKKGGICRIRRKIHVYNHTST